MKISSLHTVVILFPALALLIAADPSSQPTTLPAVPRLIDASDAAAIQDALPKPVMITGTVSDIDVQDSRTTIHFANTEKSEFYAIVLTRNKEAVEAVHGEGLKNIQGKSIHVTGKLVEYQGKPEIVISKPEQITIADK